MKKYAKTTKLINKYFEAVAKGEMRKADLTNLGVDTLVGAIPGVGAILGVAKGLAKVAQDAYKLDDAELMGAGLQTLNIDPMISMIIDDKVENRFLQRWVEKFAGMDDSVELTDVSATKALQQFLRDEYYSVLQKTRGGER